MLSTLWSLAVSHWQALAGASAVIGILVMVVTALGPAAVLAIVKTVPRWAWELLIGLALILAFGVHERHVGAAAVQALWNADKAAIKKASDDAVDLRREQNKAIAAQQAITSGNIQKGHDDEMDKVRADLRNSERLRLGAAWCDGGQPAGPPSASGAGSGNGSDTAGRVLSPEMDRAVKSLIEETEEVAAAARAAQKFLRMNDLAP